MKTKPNKVLFDSSRDFTEKISSHLALMIDSFRGGTAKIIGYIIGTKVIIRILSTIAGIILARTLGPEGRGALTAALILPRVIANFGHLGVPISNVYYIGKKRDPESLLINTLYFLIIASIIYISISILILPILKKTYFYGLNSQFIIYLSLFTIALFLFKRFLQSFLRGLEEYKEFNYVDLLSEFLRVGLIILFLCMFDLTAELAIIAFVISHILAIIYSFIVVNKQVSIRPQKADRSQFNENLSYSLKEYLGNVFTTLNVEIDLFIISAFMDKASIGIYSVAIAISHIFQFIPSSISVVLLPKIARASADNISTMLIKSIISNAAILFMGWIIFMIIGRWLVPFMYGEKFFPSYSLGVIVLLGSIILSFSQIINKYFSGIGRPEIKSIIRAINLPIKAVALYFLITRYGLTGAAWAFVITTSSLLLLTLYFYNRTKKQVATTHREVIENDETFLQEPI